MKKLSFLFVALALVGFITLSSCKSSTQPAEEESSEEVVEESMDDMGEAVDTAAAMMADSTEAAAEVVEE